MVLFRSPLNGSELSVIRIWNSAHMPSQKGYQESIATSALLKTWKCLKKRPRLPYLEPICFPGYCIAVIVARSWLVDTIQNSSLPTLIIDRFIGAVYAKCCDGPRTYSGKKVDDAVMSVVRQYFASINSVVTDLWKENARKQLKFSSKNRIKQLTATLERLDREQDALKREVVKSLSGESDFDRDLLKSLLADNKRAHEETEAEIDQAKKEAAFEEDHVKKLEKQFQEIVDWSAQFEKASADTQKMILARIIERIDIYRGYEIVIKFFVTLEDFLGDASKEITQEKPRKIS